MTGGDAREARMQVGRAARAMELGRPDEALRLYRRAAEMCVAAEDAHGEGLALVGCAQALSAMDDHAESLAYFRAAAARFRELGDQGRRLVTELAWMDALVELERWDEVSQHATHAL